MRRFEFVGGGSSKFWCVETRGRVLIVQFGRIGTPGQSKTKGLENSENAKREAERLIAQKLAKGYREVARNRVKGAPGPAPGRQALARPNWAPRTITWERESKFGDLAFSADGRRLLTLSGGAGMKLRIWQPNREQPERVLAVPTPPSRGASAIGIAPNGRWIMAGTKALRVWNLEDGRVAKERPTLKGHTDTVRSIDFSTDGTRIVTASDDCTVRHWNAATGKVLRIFRHAYPLTNAWLVNKDRRIVSCCERLGRVQEDFGGLQTFDLTGGKVAVLRRRNGEIADWWAAAVSRDRRLLAAMASDGAIDIWDLERNTHLRCVSEYGHGPAVRAVFTPDDKRLVLAHEKSITVLDLATWKPTATFRGDRFVAVTPDGQWLAFLLAINKVRIQSLPA